MWASEILPGILFHDFHVKVQNECNLAKNIVHQIEKKNCVYVVTVKESDLSISAGWVVAGGIFCSDLFFLCVDVIQC